MKPTARIEECLWDLEPLLPELVVVSVGELVGDVGNGRGSLVGVVHIMHLQFITGQGCKTFRGGFIKSVGEEYQVAKRGMEF